MTSVKLMLTGAQAYASVNGPLTSGMVGIPVTIEYDEAWDGLTNNLMCRCSPWGSDEGEIRTILNVGEASAVTHEVMQSGLYLYLGVEGFSSDGKLVIPTTWARCGKIEYGANTTDDPTTQPELSIWNQLQTEVEQIKRDGYTQEQIDEIQAYVQSASRSAASAAKSESNAAAASNIAVSNANLAEIYAKQAQASAEAARTSAGSAANLANGALQAQRAAEAAAQRAEAAAGSGCDVSLTTDQINALDGMFRVCAFTQADVSAQYSAFQAAFGLDGGDTPEDPDVPGVDDGFDSGLIDLTAQTVVDSGGATHQVLNKHTLLLTGAGGSSYSYILVNGLTPGQTYNLHIKIYDTPGNASVYGNKTPDATDDSGYGSKIRANADISVAYNPLTFTLPADEFGIIIYCYTSVTGLRLVVAEG